MLLDQLLTPTPTVEPEVTKTLERARARHESWKPGWARNLAFVQGRQFSFIDANTKRVSELETREFGSKPRWRSRTVRNRIQGYVAGEISMATSRVPGYEVTPSSTDPQDINAARLAEKLLVFFYDYLRMRKHLVDAYYFAVNCGEGFIRPYWNPKAGERLPDILNPLGEPEPPMYEGDLALRTYGPDQVYWEPGLRFEESKWHAIDIAMTMDQIKALPGWLGVELKPNAQGHSTFVEGQMSKGGTRAEMTLVTEYLELPGDKHPEGRRLMLANNKAICQPENYPCVIHGPDGPEPVLHKMSYFPTPDRERDMGLTEHLVDPQAMLNLAINKSADWMNYAMNPQWVTGPGGLRDRRTNEPGAIFRSKTGSDDVKPINVPSMPPALMEIARAAIEDMEEISSQRGIPAGLESAKALSALIERDNIRRAFITQNLADFHSRLGRHLLAMAQKYYDAPRTLAISGRRGTEYIADFKGANLRDQLTVRVLPGSIEPRTRQSIEAKIQFYAGQGWISGEQAIAAIEGGHAEGLVEKFELNRAKQQREIQQILAMSDDGLPGGSVPIASGIDNHAVHLEELETWMLTEEYERSHDLVKEAAELHREQHQFLQAEALAKEQAQQVQAAQELGMANAARPSTRGMPSLPGPDAAQ